MKRILSIAFTLLSMSSMAQVTLSVGRFGFIAPDDTVAAGSSDTYSVWVKNEGPGAFSGSFQLHTGLFDSTGTSVDTVDTYFSGGGIMINAGDSISVTLTNNYVMEPAGLFRYGIDVIVIWPVAVAAITGDSLIYSVYIDGNIGMNELDIEELIKAYPNPTNDRITLKAPASKQVEVVTIYDMGGKIMISERNSNIINLETLPAGTYMAEVVLSNKKRYSIHLVKRNK
jgi:hypothetical protein